jgi:hypothetical protein
MLDMPTWLIYGLMAFMIAALLRGLQLVFPHKLERKIEKMGVQQKSVFLDSQMRLLMLFKIALLSSTIGLIVAPILNYMVNPSSCFSYYIFLFFAASNIYFLTAYYCTKMIIKRITTSSIRRE